MSKLLLIALICFAFSGFSQRDDIKISGTVFGERSRFPYDTVKTMGAKVILSINDTLKFNVFTDENGYYEFNLKKFIGKLQLTVDGGKNVGIKGKKTDGFLSSRDVRIMQMNSSVKKFTADFMLKEVLACGGYFPELLFKENSLDFENDTLISKDKSEETIQSFFTLLVDNPTIVIEICAHCDSQEKNNVVLSTKRAELICNILIKKGIEKDRLKGKAYGSKQPLISEQQIKNAKSDKERNILRGKNRRIALKILSFDYGVKESNKKVLDDKDEE